MARFTKQVGKIAKSMDEAERYVRAKAEFCTPLVKQMMDGTSGRRMVGKWLTDENTGRRISYTVYSYADWWPIFVYDPEVEMWYGNSNKYSRTTTKHQRHVQPPNVTQWLDVTTLYLISRKGIAEWVRQKMQTAP